MAEKKSWRDYSKNYSGDDSKDKSSDEEKTGTWRDYSQSHSSGNTAQSGKASGSWRDYSTVDTGSIVGSNVVNRVNSWLKNHNDYISSYQSRYSGRKGSYEDAYVSDSADWLETVKSQKSNFDAEADGILSYMEEYKDYLDADWMNKVKTTLLQSKSTQNKILNNSIKDKMYWDSFGSEELVKEYGSAEDAYKASQRYDGYSKKYSGQKSEDIMKTLESLEDGEEKNWLSQHQYELYGTDAAYKSKAASGRKSYEAQMIAEQQKDADKSFWEFVAESYAYAPADTSLPAAALSNAQAAYRNDDSYRRPNDKWSEEEWDHFGVLWTESPDKAYKYAEQVNNQINAMAQYEQQQKVGSWASQNLGTGVLGTLGAVATAPLGMADFLDNIVEYSARGTITQKGVLSPFDFGQAAQSGIANKLNEAGTLDEDMFAIGGKGWGDVYSLGVSAANSLVSAYTLGGTGTLVNFIGQGGASGVDDALSRGATAGQALLYGSIVGAAEGVTEMIGADNLLKIGSSSTLKNYLLKALNQGIGESIEEGASSIIGNVADNIIMQDKSNFNTMVKELMEADPNMTEEEAKKKAWLRMVGDVAFDAMGGFATGSTNAMSVGGVSTAIDARKGNQKNIDAINQYGNKTDALIQEGLESDVKSDSYKLATKYKQQVQGTEKKAGKALTGAQIRNLLAANQEQITPKDLKKIQQAAEKRLTELGQTEDVAKVAELATKRATGQKLSRSEKSFLANSQYGARVANELLPENIASGDYATEWAEEIGTKSVNKVAYNKKQISELLEKMASMEDTAAYKSLEDRVGTETTFKTSKDGQATISKTGETIDLGKAEVAEFIKDKKGNIVDMVIKADGKEVKASEVDYADGNQSYLFEAVSKIENITPRAATAIVRDYNPSSGQTVGEYLNGIDEGFTYGYYGYTEADLKAGNFAPKLTDTQMKSAYVLGQDARSKNDVDADAPIVKMRTAMDAKLTAEQKAEKQKARIESKDVEVYFQDGKTTVKFDEHTGKYDKKRMAAVNTAKFLSKLGIGGKYYFFESYLSKTLKDADGNALRVYKDANGNEVEAPNGIYKETDGSIHIDLNAGDAGQGTALFTLGHELAHFVKDRSKKQFKILSDLVAEAFDKTDVSMHERVLAKQKFLEDKRGEAVSYTEAHEEVVADAMSTMLSDGSFFEMLMDIKVKDKGLFNTIKRFFEKMIAKFTKVYAELDPDQQDAQDIREMKDMFDKIQKAFAEALVEASENFQAAMESVVEENAKPMPAEEIVTDGAVVTDGNGERHSIRSMKHDITEGKMFDDLKSVCGWTDAQVNTLRTQLNDLVDYMIPYRNILDMNETYGMEGRRFSPYKPNSDPLYKISMDFSTLCSKRLLTQYVIEQLQLRENRPMSAEEQMAIRDMLNEYRKVEKGLQVACAMCYVEAARLKSPKQIQRWLDDPTPHLVNYFAQKNAEFNATVKKAQADFKESKGYDRDAPKKDMKPADVKELNKIGPRLRSQYKLSAEEQAIVERAKALPNSTYLTAGNLADLSESEPVIYNAYTSFVRTATRSKSLEKDEPYYYGDSNRDNGNGIVVTDSFIDAVNKENGMRFSSWSDWRIIHLLDYITAVIDNSVRGAAMHGYTKFGDEVRVLGKTGMMFNMSGVTGTQTGLNEDGSLNFSETESIDVDEAIQLREEFPETAGLQCIGVSDAHIIALLRSDIIDYVIPYHVSGLNADLRRMAKIYGWDDYTGTQHAAIDKSIKLEDAVDKEHWREEPVFSEFFVGYDTGMSGIEAMKASAERYKQMCKDRGLTPKFNQFATEDNYWKLLIDRKMINQQTGKLIQQKAVTPTFDFDVIKGVVDSFVENYDAGLEGRALNHIVENWDSIPQRIKDLKKKGGTKTKKTAKAVDTLSNQTLAAQPTKNSDRQNKNRASSDSPLTRRSVKQRSVGSTHIKMPSTAAAEKLGIENIAKYSDSVKEAVAVLGELFTSVDLKKPVLGFKRPVSASSLEGALVAMGVLKREGTSGSAYRYDDGHALRISNHSANANNFVGDGEHLSIALFERGKMNDFVEGESNVIEAVFRRKYLDGNPDALKQVIHDIAHFIADGEYHDTAGAMRYNFSGTEAFKKQAQQRMADDKSARGQKFSERDSKGDFLADDQLKGNYTVTEISEMFDAWNSDPELTDLSKKVFDKLQEMMDEQENAYWATPYPIRFKSDAYLQKAYYITPNGIFEPSRTDGNYGITYNLDYFRKVSDQEKARVLLHEAIHACTVGAIKSTERRIPKQADPMEFTPDDSWSEAQKASLELIQVFSQVRVANERNEYGQKNVYEMVAEMSNPEFRAMLKKERLWNRIVDAIKRILGIEQKTAYDAVSNALEKILELDMPRVETVHKSERGNAPTFYSKMGKVVDGMKQEKFGASSVISMLRGRGVKAEEIRWSGIQAFLDGKKSVSKAELLEFINGSMLHIEEESRTDNKVRDEFIQAWRNFIDQDLNESEILDGLNSLDEMEGYLESLVEDEDLDRYYADYILRLAHEVANSKDLPTKWSQYKLDGGENYRELVFKMPGSTFSNAAMRTHWGDGTTGVLAHARLQDLNTFIGKMLFIEEIQSDWHNEGHKVGYIDESKRLTVKNTEMRHEGEWYNLYHNGKDLHQGVTETWLKDRFRNGITEDEIHEGLVDEYNRVTVDKQSVPDAPFKDNYHEFVLKRLLRVAAEQGYDSIGWTTADIQSKRWSDQYAEGYRIEYDQDIPKFLKKYGKQWDSTVGKTVLDNGTEVWSMAITDSMKDSVLKEGQELYSERGNSTSNRSLLANAFEGLSQSSVEYKMIQDYKEQIKVLNMLDEQLSNLNAEIHEIRFTKGKYDAEKLRKLEEKAERIASDINKQDKVLIRMEASETLRKIIDFERKKASKKTKEHIAEIQQNKKARAEQTELRHKIRKTVRDLDKILNRANKKQNVKEDMKGFVSKALELADYLFTDHVSNDDLIRKGITVRMTQREAALVKETEDILSQLYDNADGLTDEEFARLDAKRKANEDKLRDLLTAQRNEKLNTPVYNLFNDLVTEYASLKNSKQEAVKGAYDPKVEEFLRSYLGETADGTDSDRKILLQNMRVADMTTEELWKLHNAYTMVLHSVRQANSLFVKGKTESIEQMAGRIMSDFSKRKAPDGKVATVIRNLSNKMGWDYEKLYYALDRIGSESFTELVMNLADAENTVMQDIMEAVAFRDEIVKKYGFNNWKVNKEIDKEFLDTTGKKFKMTLGQLMSLYAYSRREGAWDHIEYGGFVFGEAALTNPKPADSYKLSKAQCEAITNTLTKEQKGYVEDMQKFLSETMGAKGNEVSMLLYGINMFGEKNYFPIHIAGQFKAQANESQAKAAAGFGTMTNAGFTHAQNPNAKAPFVLEGFNEIWADHVNEMSRYHGTVPALEDMRRVMNRSSYSEAEAESMAIKQLMENSFGKDAVEYFDNLYREANSGAITDKMQRRSKKLLSLFRKNSVAYSLSVIIQQPSAMVRAYAMIDPKYFGFKGVGAFTSGVAKAVSSKWNPAYANAYNEMMKYAPGVTMAKEIGGFDTHTGSSIREYLLDTGKSFKQRMKTENLLGKGKAVLDLVDDNAIANLPSVADKIAWIEIWNACKRETVAKHKDLATNSEEFMQAVGERFTEVIRATQVYDSIFAKSPMLKSKNLAVQYLVSFMNEPNTTANMAEKAVRDATKGNWNGGLRIAGAVTYSIIFNNVLKAIVYAMRDDDEDETYIEKYLAAVAGGMMDDFNVLNYIPIVRDVWSKARGFDVERPDMAIITDAIDAYQAIAKVKGKDTEGMTEEELAELDKKVTDASWKLVGSLAAFFGIPVKNIYREIDGVIDHARIASANADMTTASGIWNKVKEEIIDSIPFVSAKETKTDKLYDAIISGDTKYLERMKGTYKDEDAYQSAVRKALRENDPRIHEAAQARYDGNTEEYKRIFREIQKEGKFSFDDIMSAVNSEESKIRNKLEPEKATSDYTANGYVEAIAMGNTTEAMAMKDDIIATKVANGKTQEEAEKEFKSSVATGIGEAYSSGLLDEAQAEKMLVEYAGKDEEEAASKVSYWSYLDAHPEYEQYNLSESNVKDYLEFAEPAEIPMDVYVQFRDGTKGLAEIKDEWGDVEVTKREQVLEVIDSLPLTWQQKDALYLAAGYSESKIWDVPW